MLTQHIQDFDPLLVPSLTKEARRLVVTRTSSGQEVAQTVLLVGGAQPGPLLVVIAGLHGNEYEGPHTVMQLYEELQPSDIRGALVMMPVANVLAFETGARETQSDGLDMNRAFPGDPKGSITQQMAYWLGEQLVRQADFCIDLHSGGRLDIPLLCSHVSGEGHAAELSQKVARSFGAPITHTDKSALPAQLEGFAREQGVPLVYTECPAHKGINLEAVSVYGRGVRNAMRVMGMLEGEIEGKPGRHLYAGGDPALTLTATVGGFFTPLRQVLDYVHAGDLLGTTCDFSGAILEEFRAPCDGYLLMRRWSPNVHAGDKMIFTLALDHQTW